MSSTENIERTMGRLEGKQDMLIERFDAYTKLMDERVSTLETDTGSLKSVMKGFAWIGTIIGSAIGITLASIIGGLLKK